MDRNEGLIAEPLFVGMTRPAMKWGVTYSGLIINVSLVMYAFLFTKNLLWLLAFFPIHLIMTLVCLYEPRFFDLLMTWMKTSLWSYITGVRRHWKAYTYSPLEINVPNRKGYRKAPPVILGGDQR